MKINIICVGRLKERFFLEAAAHYATAVKRRHELNLIQLDDSAIPQNSSPKQNEQVKVKEGRGILGRIDPTDYVVALDLSGTSVNASAFAGLLKTGSANGRRVTFVIGGSLGLSDEVLTRADKRISLSKMTFTHNIAQIILLERLAAV